MSSAAERSVALGVLSEAHIGAMCMCPESAGTAILKQGELKYGRIEQSVYGCNREESGDLRGGLSVQVSRGGLHEEPLLRADG